MANTYYPALSSILSVDYLPEELNFISSNLNELLNNVHFKDLMVEKPL
ncbi:hypothetical protein [Nubsella zeaxanthinifaciens]|jgi:hypothetical protein|nr:hypothetical protein [Nubsella zeaxanthinifaciens]